MQRTRYRNNNTRDTTTTSNTKATWGKNKTKYSHKLLSNNSKKNQNTQTQKHDITLIIQEESYTSKSSFLDYDILPTYDENQKGKKYEFKGKRIYRGLYKTQKGKLLNADVNAAANIIRKSKQKFNLERLYKWAQTAPSKIKPHKI